MSQAGVGGVRSCGIVLEVATSALVDVTVMHDEDPSRPVPSHGRRAAVVAGRIPARDTPAARHGPQPRPRVSRPNSARIWLDSLYSYRRKQMH